MLLNTKKKNRMYPSKSMCHTTLHKKFCVSDIVVDGAHLSLQKSAYGNYGSSSETQPLLGHDSKSAMANSTSSHKSKKLNRRSGAEVKRYGSDDRVQFSKAVNRNLVEQAKVSNNR